MSKFGDFPIHSLIIGWQFEKVYVFKSNLFKFRLRGIIEMYQILEALVKTGLKLRMSESRKFFIYSLIIPSK